MGTLSTLAGGGLPTICQQKGLLAGLGQLYFAHLLKIFQINYFSKNIPIVFFTVCQDVVSPQRFLLEILRCVVRNPQHACFYINLFIISHSLKIIKMCKEKISENY